MSLSFLVCRQEEIAGPVNSSEAGVPPAQIHRSGQSQLEQAEGDSQTP